MRTFKKLFQVLRSLRKDQKGIAAVELALVTPVILTLILASTDLTRYLLAHQKISRAAYTMSNLMTQMDEGLTESQVSDILLALGEVSQPLNLDESGKATITAIVGVGVDGSSPDGYEVAWQRCYGAATIASNTLYGAQGSTVSDSIIPDHTITVSSQILVVTEITYEFEPLVGFLTFNNRIEYSSFFRPRLGSIEQITQDGSPSSTC